MKLGLGLIVCLLATLTIACRSTPDVIITDHRGAPLANATVEPVGQSVNYKTVTTDSKGEAVLSPGLQEVRWINVRKTGFTDQNSIDFTGPKPIRVIMK